MITDKSINSYLSEAASRSPAPGGGSVCALSGALGASMVSMAANFTIGKKNYESVQEEVKKILSESEKLRLRFSELVEEDIKAYSTVSSAYSMARGTDDEKKVRSERIAAVTKEAAAVPMETAKCCFRILELCRSLVDIGNKNLISDVGVAVLLAESALRGANLNVEINLACLKDKFFIDEKRDVMKLLVEESRKILDIVLKKVEKGSSG